jgi:hypothetical protein
LNAVSNSAKSDRMRTSGASSDTALRRSFAPAQEPTNHVAPDISTATANIGQN